LLAVATICFSLQFSVTIKTAATAGTTTTTIVITNNVKMKTKQCRIGPLQHTLDASVIESQSNIFQNTLKLVLDAMLNTIQKDSEKSHKPTLQR
jgi:hypothetical protein